MTRDCTIIFLRGPPAMSGPLNEKPKENEFSFKEKKDVAFLFLVFLFYWVTFCSLFEVTKSRKGKKKKTRSC